MPKVLITCPPMLNAIDSFREKFDELNWDVTTPSVVQTVSERVLRDILPDHDGWIIGDDILTAETIELGVQRQFKAAVKWGIGVDNIDLKAVKHSGLLFSNTPNVFGAEVSDMALGYLIALARGTFSIDRSVRSGEWKKPAGISIAGKTAAIIGLGDVGKNLAVRLSACGMRLIGYDPYADESALINSLERKCWPESISDADFIVVTCELNTTTYHLLNAEIFDKVKAGVRIVNVARGPVICETDLIDALDTGIVHSAALDVFEIEPLPISSPFLKMPQCILGSHNASNTQEAVIRTSEIAIAKLSEFLNETPS